MLPPSLSSVYEHIQSNQEAFIQRLMDYVRHPSISAHDIGIREVSEILVEMLTKIGLETRTLATAGHPMVLGRWEKSPGAPTVLLYGHYDVQPPDPLEEWISPPFEPTIRDGRIYARGVGDNKGQHLAQILAIESHLQVHGKLPCNIIVLLEGEEEIGSPHIADFVREHREILNADLVITADGHVHNTGTPVLKYGVRGVASFELRARGANRDVHSGNYGGVVPNPIWTLIHLLASMKNERGEVTIEGFHDRVIPPTPAELVTVAGLPLDLEGLKAELDLEQFDQPLERPFYDRLMFHPTFTINGFHGGYGGPGSKTVLPHEAVVKCDIRLVEAQTPDEILEKVRVHVKRVAPGVDFIPLDGMLPSKTPMDSPFATPLRQAITTAQGVVPLEYPCTGGSLPDYVFTKILNIPAFVTPYGNADESNHAPNENLALDCFINGIRTGAAVLTYLGAM
ncbi:MAG: M20/M25/M40 family metallo-hydrolase [Anaerolineales bacterium]|nr:M20/M25/M40 family metallo-hydrolase [Anaerolineales bacterium]